MSDPLFVPCRNGQSLSLRDVPELSLAEFRDAIIQGSHGGQRLSCLCADSELRLFAVLAEDGAGRLSIGRTKLDQPRFQRTDFERVFDIEIVVAGIHAWHAPMRRRSAAHSHPANAPRAF